MPDIKELFKQFVFGYIAAGHTQTDESEAELKKWIATFIDTLDDNDCFDRCTMLDILDYVEDHMSDDNKQFYRYYLQDFTYNTQLENYIKYIVKLFNKDNF